MNDKLIFQQADGSQWAVPMLSLASEVAMAEALQKSEHRAQIEAEHGEQMSGRIYELASDYEQLYKQARHLIPWDVVKRYAVQVAPPREIDYDATWREGRGSVWLEQKA